MNEESKEYFRIIEKGIGKIPLEYREKIYCPCAVNCVSGGVFELNKQQFDECNGDMDLMWEKYPETEFYFRKIIEKGHIYEMGYPRCLCDFVNEGICNDSGHCECSRQSIIYILTKLMPDKNIKVETIETVLDGAKQCRFRITIE